MRRSASGPFSRSTAARGGAISASDEARALAQRFRLTGAIRGCWHGAVEKPSLGGLLLLRQELELLAALAGVVRVDVHFAGPVPVLAKAVFNSRCAFHASASAATEPFWPPAEAARAPHFSHQFFDRVSLLAAILSQAPALAWSPQALDSAAAFRRRTQGRLVTLHLKNVPGQTEADSNAVFHHWHEFLAAHAEPGALEFLLLGADEVPEEILDLGGVRSAQREAIPLQAQLALAARSDGFIGMASGVCPAAVLSDTPYVLFKDPAHHVEEMARELGEGDRFAFARPRQLVWRVPHTPAMLARALDMVLGESA